MRESGVLLPITALPSKYGIGCFDEEAYKFVDHLKQAKQSIWQILPLGITGYGDSPYQSFSTFAGNPYFISLDALVKKGWLSQEDLPKADIHSDYVDYEYIYYHRYPLLRKAYENSHIEEDADFNQYVKDNQSWLEDYALFMAIKAEYNDESWLNWPRELRLREEAALNEKRESLHHEMVYHEFLQYLFWKQWYALKAYANANGVKIIGDIPIYVAFDSSDVWANPELFQLDNDVKPTAVAGVPPDGFSADGQLWGNPLYDWPKHKETGYAWWISRIAYCKKAYDVVRIDHFRGFDEYFSIPYGDKTARNGHWEKGPGYDLFKSIEEQLGSLDVIAEDLGYLTDSVKKLVSDCGYPGMKIFEFAFDSRDSSGANAYLPHNYTENSVVYTGTHDNETMMGWFKSILPEEKQALKDYLHTDTTYDDVLLDKSIEMVFSSVSKLCVIPMQDYLYLDNRARMNQPNTLGDNWKWRMSKDDFNDELIKRMNYLSKKYNRNEGDSMTIESRINEISNTLYNKPLNELSDAQVYTVLLHLVKGMSDDLPMISGKKKVYYFSAEFLIGKLMSNNLINLGIRKDVKDVLSKNGFDLAQIEEIEAEPSLGNGGLGRLAACFLDSIATLGLPGDGVGLNYHLGLFKQEFKDNKQFETPNPWINNQTWLNKTKKSYVVDYKDFSLKSELYDIDVLGYKGYKNKLHLFDIATVDPTIVHDGIAFDKEDILKNLTLFLYPDDSDEDGRKLRIYQQYFMVSNGAQMIIEDLKARKIPLEEMPEYVAIQINDTHPSMVIPELIRLLMKEGMHEKKAIQVVTKTCAYTNHTILAEALEKWPMYYLEEIVPQLVPIIQSLDAVAHERSENPKVQIIDDNNVVHMAHMDIHFGHSINGVAAIHTDILKDTELKDFYDLYPKKFNNKTNGITFRRWLLACNEELTSFIDSLIGEGYKENADELEKLLQFVDNDEVLDRLVAIKEGKKADLAKYIEAKEGITLDPNSIFDVQVKRLHEYKRQQMNLLSIIDLYLDIKRGNVPAHPITCIFGAKAAPAYVLAKDIIHTILCVAQIVNNDPEVNKHLKVVMVQNYNVTYAEHIIPAADFSEQISLASKEASGTSNMKFMLNGAVTLGTDDGANVEIHQLVGDDNIYIFGADSDTVIKHYENADYHSRDILENNEHIKELVEFIVSDQMLAIGDKDALYRLHNDLWDKDWFMALLDVEDYIKTKKQAINDFSNRRAWAKKMLVNIAKAGYFSSDRTIKQYNDDIWKLK